uniref:T-cell surface glycoprotein CD3 zeta chain n=1 Tax=Mola mola TaxID=94237 RepID=A0A3Q3WQU0_MOLML
QELTLFVSSLVVVKPPNVSAMTLYDPRLCYILDVFLGLYGLIITGMFIKEKFFTTKAKAADEPIYNELKGQDSTGYDRLIRGDPERGRVSRSFCSCRQSHELTKRTDGEYKELPVKRERRKNEQVYQGLSTATKDTYQSLQMKTLSPR